ncbi:MAG: TerB N-terminal domain-containing protein [Clostridia bacterium]|nr:TerB N-terminal domain-containing protein [Clostridia bacterium]
MPEERDDFWDLPEITPKRKHPEIKNVSPSATDAVKLTFGEATESKKYIIPARDKKNGAPEKHSEVILEYQPEDSLILSVRICKWPSDYSFYNRFLQDAHKYYRVKCDEAPFVPFFSYLPQYNQMNIDQLRFYLYWRRQVSHGNFIKTDYSYIFLYLYELINLEDVSTPEKRLSAMCSVLNGYRNSFSSLDRYLGEWICDFCLIHRLPPPNELPDDVLSDLMTVVSLREFYIKSRENVHDTAMRDLIIRNNKYNYTDSAAYGPKTKSIFDAHLIRSVIYTIEKTENVKDGEPNLQKTCVSRTAYNGALCVSGTKCRIDAEYLSLNRSYRFRGIITSLVKCAENNIRAALGIKSRLSEAGLSKETVAVMKEYYAANLPPQTQKRVKRVTPEEAIRYELYEAKDTGFDPASAAEIELSSWELTKRLVEDEAAASADFTESSVTDPGSNEVSAGVFFDTTENNVAQSAEKTPYELLCGSLPPHALEYLRRLCKDGPAEARRFCRENALMEEAVVSDVNDLAYEYTNDIIIDNGNIIEDYLCDVSGALDKI